MYDYCIQLYVRLGRVNLTLAGWSCYGEIILLRWSCSSEMILFGRDREMILSRRDDLTPAELSYFYLFILFIWFQQLKTWFTWVILFRQDSPLPARWSYSGAAGLSYCGGIILLRWDYITWMILFRQDYHTLAQSSYSGKMILYRRDRKMILFRRDDLTPAGLS